MPATTVTNTYAIDPNYRIGYAQIWQFSVQNDLGHSLVGTITYNGTKGTGLDQTIPAEFGALRAPRPIGLPAGYIYEQVQRQFDLSRRLVPTDAALPQRRLGQRHLHLLEGHRQRACRSPELPGHFGRARALSAGSRTHVLNLNWQYSTGVGTRRRHAGQRLEGRALEGLDLHQQHHRVAADRR